MHDFKKGVGLPFKVRIQVAVYHLQHLLLYVFALTQLQLGSYIYTYTHCLVHLNNTPAKVRMCSIYYACMYVAIVLEQTHPVANASW